MTLAAAAALAVSGSVASAATFIDLTGPFGTSPSVTTSADGITVTVSPGTLSGSTISSTGSVAQSGFGVGVSRAPLDFFNNGFLADEILVFDFDQEVSIVSIEFISLPFDFESFQFGTVDGAAFTELLDAPIGGTGFVSTVEIGSDFDTSFGIASTGFLDLYVVSGITVAPIPVPAAGLLLLTGLGGIVVMKRRKKAAAPVAA